jgi:hypothetical protein
MYVKILYISIASKKKKEIKYLGEHLTNDDLYRRTTNIEERD